MKITFVDQNIDGMGGVERIICTLANGLSENNDILIINEERKNAEPFFKYNDNIKIINILNFYNESNKKKANKYINLFDKIIQKVARKNIKIFINKNIKEELYKSDVIIFGRSTVSFKYLKLFLRREKRPQIIVRDASNYYCISSKAKKKIKKLFPKIVDTFIVSSDESMKIYQDFFKEKNIKMKKIYNPLGIIPNVGYNYDSKNIVALGRFDKQKGFENLILAFSIVNKKYPDWKLSIYGKGNYGNKLKKIIKENNIKNAFIKSQEKDVVKIFNESSIYVMSSRYEGYANSLVEALACGIPSISYDWLTGPDEIIKNNVNGLIVNVENRIKFLSGEVNSHDINELAKAIIHLIENQDVCKKLSENSIKIVESRDKNKIIAEWEKIIRSK